ncbi:hypothetical protein D3C75_1020380 [compost metagenome]
MSKVQDNSGISLTKESSCAVVANGASAASKSSIPTVIPSGLAKSHIRDTAFFIACIACGYAAEPGSDSCLFRNPGMTSTRDAPARLAMARKEEICCSFSSSPGSWAKSKKPYIQLTCRPALSSSGLIFASSDL